MKVHVLCELFTGNLPKIRGQERLLFKWRFEGGEEEHSGLMRQPVQRP